MRKEDYVRPHLRRMVKNNAYGVYFIFKSMEQGATFRVSVPKFPTQDPNHRILAHQRSRFTHYYFYVRDQVLGPMVIRVASLLPLPGHLLSQRPLVHGTGTEPRTESAFARTTTRSWRPTTSNSYRLPLTGSARS